jgi:hypothetical protein
MIESFLNRTAMVKTFNGNKLCCVEEKRENGFFLLKILDTNKQIIIHRQNIEFMPVILARFRESNFQKLASIWAKALQEFPREVLVTSVLSNETLARKIREAREAKQRHGWLHSEINEEQWKLLAHEISVEVTDKGVLLASKVHKQQERNKKNLEIEFETSTKTEWVVTVTATFEKIETLCLMLSSHSFEPAPIFILKFLTDEQAQSLEERYDIVLVKENNEWRIL